MRNAWHLFVNDMRRITGNVVTGIILLGLVFLPSIFSWYNVLASWDVFGNTGNLTVAVANTDEGYKSDLIPLKVNIGAQVESGLRANDQLNWVFVSEDEAIDGAQSGKYYAAVVIPKDFSRNMMTFYEENSESASVIYYTNEKKSAIAPKVTDQGASKVSYEINVAFTETLTDAGLNILQQLSGYADEANADSTISALADHINVLSSQMHQTSGTLRAYSSLIGSSQKLVSGSSELLSSAQSSAHDIARQADNAKEGVSAIGAALDAAVGALDASISSASGDYEKVEAVVKDAFEQSNVNSASAASSLRDAASSLKLKNNEYASIEKELETIKATAPSDYVETIDSLITALQGAQNMNDALVDMLEQSANDIETGSASASDHYAEIESELAEARKSLNELTTEYDDKISPELSQLASDVSNLVHSLSASAGDLDSAATSLVGETGSVECSLSDAKAKIDSTANELDKSADQLSDVSAKIKTALASGDVQTLKDILGTDSEFLANILASPVEMDRIAIFPADNFGSQMAPLYTTLAVWIGSLLSVVAIKVNVSKKQREELNNPKPRELFFGRFGVFAFVSLAQTTTMALGNMLFLGIQAMHPLLYMICFWVGGLVFTFIMYVFVLSFANLGKAIGVLLLILQVTAGGGSFPLPMLPDFFQVISPYIPATHMINAMRASMMGVYQNDFWIEIVRLLAFTVPMFLLGLALRKPLERFLKWYVRKVEESKLVS